MLASSGCSERPDRVLVRVGRWTISAEDASRRDGIIRIMYPGDERRLGLLQLTKSYLRAQVLENNGWLITPERLLAEQQRIQERTRDPATLARIQAIFGNDLDSYRKVFVLPNLADRVLEPEFFRDHPKIHEGSRAKAERLLRKLGKAPSLGSSEDPAIRRLVVPLKGSLEETELEEEVYRWAERLKKKGERVSVYPHIIHADEEWHLFRYTRGAGSGRRGAQVEVFVVPRVRFSDWYREEIRKVVVDPPLPPDF